MEMQLHRSPLEGCRPVYQGMLRQEETLESIVPDALPDIARIVECRGNALLRQKETVDGSVRVTGTVRACVLYLPEGGSDLCALALNIPFLSCGDHPAIRAGSQCKVSVKVICADAQALNPRKLLARVEVGVCVTVYGGEECHICTEAEGEERIGLQTLREEQTDFTVSCVSEKHISFTDVIRLSSVRPAVRQLLCHRAEVTGTEVKIIGKKAAVKGDVVLSILYLEESGVASARYDLPFSQVIELPAAYEDCQAEGEAVLTGLHCEERNEGELEVTVEALLQVVVQQERKLSLVSDLYCVSAPVEAERERVTLRELVDRGSRRQAVRQFCPVDTPVRQVTECRLTVGEVNLIPDGDKTLASAKVYVNVLAVTEEEGLTAAGLVVPVTCELPLVGEGAWDCGCTPAGETLATPVSGGVEVRFEALFTYLVTRSQGAETVAAVRSGRQEECTGRRPSLRVRAVEPGERLWDLAKCCASTVDDIRAANGLSEEEIRPGIMLLVPRCR